MNCSLQNTQCSNLQISLFYWPVLFHVLTESKILLLYSRFFPLQKCADWPKLPSRISDCHHHSTTSQVCHPPPPTFPTTCTTESKAWVVSVGLSNDLASPGAPSAWCWVFWGQKVSNLIIQTRSDGREGESYTAPKEKVTAHMFCPRHVLCIMRTEFHTIFKSGKG